MGENKYDRAQIQTKVLKPSVFNSINNIPGSPHGKHMGLPPKYFKNTVSGKSLDKTDDEG
jgi:hypothetical protein